jgi:hypothetical protein
MKLPEGINVVDHAEEVRVKQLPLVYRCPGMGAGCGRPISYNKRLCLAHQMELDHAKQKFEAKKIAAQKELVEKQAEEWRQTHCASCRVELPATDKHWPTRFCPECLETKTLDELEASPLVEARKLRGTAA